MIALTDGQRSAALACAVRLLDPLESGVFSAKSAAAPYINIACEEAPTLEMTDADSSSVVEALGKWGAGLFFIAWREAALGAMLIREARHSLFRLEQRRLMKLEEDAKKLRNP